MANKSKRSCAATLASGDPCQNTALGGEEYCGVHKRALAAKNSSEVDPKTRPYLTRVEKIALVLSSSISLVELLEKVMEYAPRIVDILEKMYEPTGNTWEIENILSDIKCNMQKFVNTDGSLNDDFINTVSNATSLNQEEVKVLSSLVNSLVLTHWASRLTLNIYDQSVLVSYDSLTQEEKDYFLGIRNLVNRIPFIELLRPNNFLAHLSGIYSDESGE